MKAKWISVALALCTVTSGQAFTVYDPTVHTSIIMQTVQEIAKFAEMISHQVAQVQQMTEQLNAFRNYQKTFGTPASVGIQVATPVLADLRVKEIGQSLSSVVSGARGIDSLLHDGGGLYRVVGETFATPKGVKVARDAGGYRVFAAVNAAAANFQAMASATTSRRTALKEQVAVVLEQLRAAKDAAEVAKLSGVLSGLESALAGLDQESQSALANVVVQDIENRNDQARQEKAVKEEQTAAFAEAVGNFRKTFRVVSGPTKFPALNH
jgi:hypothetical protein